MSFCVTVPTKISGRLMIASRSAIGPVIGAPPASVPLASMGRPPSVSRHRPTGSKFSSAKPGGSIVRWQPAQTGSSRCCSSRSRTLRGAAPAPLSSSAGTFGGGGFGGELNTFVMIHLPRNTGDVRFATDVSNSTLPWPSKPRRFGSVSVTRRNASPNTPSMP